MYIAVAQNTSMTGQQIRVGKVSPIALATKSRFLTAVDAGLAQ